MRTGKEHVEHIEPIEVDSVPPAIEEVPTPVEAPERETVKQERVAGIMQVFEVVRNA